MRITPLDVRKQEFRKAMRGLDPEEVYAFLATVADEYELVLNDNKALRERLLELDDKVQEYRTMEKTLRDTLLTAERVNAEAKDNARREANIIVKEAQIEAEKALRDIKTEAMKLRQQVQQLRSQRDSFLARMKVVAESHLSYIESAVKDMRKDDDADVSEEHLADTPVDREEPVRRRSARSLFEAAGAAADAVDPAAKSAAPASRPGRTSDAAPRSEPPDRPRALAGDARSRSGHETSFGDEGPDPITVIIDRMKRGQQEVLASGAGTPGYPDARGPAGPPAHGRAESRETAAPEPSPTVATLRPEPSRGKPGGTSDVTREFSLDDIRRELAAEENSER